MLGKLNCLLKDYARRTENILENSGVLATSHRNLIPADFPIRQHFYSADNAILSHSSRRIVLSYNSFVHNEVSNMPMDRIM